MKDALRILIVEDDIVDRKLLERLLAQSTLGACEVKNAERLAGALELLQSQAFDVVLLDLGLPDSQGMDSAVRLQAQAPQTPIIVLSGLDDANVATQAVQIGVQDYLIKGQVDASLLMRAIRYALERKKVERQLQAAELRYRTIFENSAVAIMMVDEQERLLSWNKFTEQLLGMTEEQLHGRHIKEFYPESQWQEIRARSIRRKGMDHHTETKMIRGDGTAIDVDISLSVVQDSEGRITGSIGVIQDITERKRAEESLLVKDRAVNDATNGIAFSDLEGKLTFANPCALKMWGFTEESEVLHQPLQLFFQSESAALAACQSTLTTGAWSGELTARRRDGTQFFVQISAGLVKDKQGQPICLMASMTDVTESRRIREILDRKQRNLEAIFDAAPLGMLLVNPHMQVARANDTIRQLSGRGYAEVIGLDPCTAVGCLRASATRDCDDCLLGQSIQTALDSGRPVRGVEVRPPLSEEPDHAQPWFSVSVEPTHIDGARHVVVALNDVTDRKRAEEELTQTMEMKSQFISTVSHELRTPLTAIREAVIIVQDEIAGKLVKDQKHFLDIAKRNIDRLARLIDDVLDFQKLNAGKMKFNLQENNLAVVVEEAYTTMQPHAAKNKVDLALELEPHLPAVICDSDRMVQILTNLISNAIKFTPEGGRVLLAVQRREEHVALKISDTGYGIPKEDLPKLFNCFFRVQRPGKEIKGTGLGLAIVSKIVTGHGGRIEVESELDKGTTFTVLLPLAGPRTPDEASEKADRSLDGVLFAK